MTDELATIYVRLKIPIGSVKRVDDWLRDLDAAGIPASIDIGVDRWTERYGGWTPDQVSRMSLLCGWFLARHIHGTYDGQPSEAGWQCFGCRVGSELLRDLLSGDPEAHR